MFKRIVFLVTIWAALLSALSCTKQPVIEYDLDHISGKWLVTSTTGKIAIEYDTVFAASDTVRFYKIRDNLHWLYVSRPGENRYYDEDRHIHCYLRIGYSPKEDKKSFDVDADRIYTFELYEATKEQVVFRLANNGAKAVLKKEE